MWLYVSLINGIHETYKNKLIGYNWPHSAGIHSTNLNTGISRSWSSFSEYTSSPSQKPRVGTATRPRLASWSCPEFSSGQVFPPLDAPRRTPRALYTWHNIIHAVSISSCSSSSSSSFCILPWMFTPWRHYSLSGESNGLQWTSMLQQ